MISAALVFGGVVDRTHANGAGDTFVLLDAGLAVLYLGDTFLADKFHAHVFFAAAELRRVHGDEERFYAARLRVLDVLPCDLAVPVHVPAQGPVSKSADIVEVEPGD